MNDKVLTIFRFFFKLSFSSVYVFQAFQFQPSGGAERISRSDEVDVEEGGRLL